MHFITCDFCGKIKKTIKKKILCERCKKPATYKNETTEYDYEQDMREIPPSKDGMRYKANPNVNVFVELAKVAIIKDYKMKHKYAIKEEDEEE